MTCNQGKASLLLAGLCLNLLGAPFAFADLWTPAVNPTTVHVENDGSVALLYFQTSQAVVNPAGCPSSDGYSISDPVILNQTTAIVLASITSGQQVNVYVSSSACATNVRPLILTVQIL
jgi:hypothetical protein